MRPGSCWGGSGGGGRRSWEPSVGCTSVPSTFGVLHHLGLDSMLDAFAHEMDHTQSRMDGVLRKMAKVSHMTSGKTPWGGSWPGGWRGGTPSPCNL